jgi:hypothetical protein
MKIDKNKTYTTKLGHKVRIYATDAGGQYPVHGAVLIGREWEQERWLSNGSYNLDDVDGFDLVEVKPRIKLTRWVNVYPECTEMHASRVLADNSAHRDRIACVEIEIDCERGQGL